MGSDLTKGNISKILFNLTLPMVGGIFAIITFNLVDTYFVGKLGALELAALSFTFPVVMVFGSISMGLSAGATSVISKAFGEGDPKKVKRLTTDALFLSVIIVAVFLVIGFFTLDPLFRLMGAKGQTLEYIKDYMRIWYGGMIFLVVPMVGNGAIRAKGISTIPAFIMTFAALTNCILDPLLIFGIGPFPALGIEGAAWATVFGRSLTLIASLWVIHFKLDMLDFSIPSFHEGFSSWKEILKTTIPNAGTNVALPLTMSVITALVSEYGNEAVAGFGIVTRIQSFAMIVLLGISSSMAPFSGQNFGAKKYNRIKTALIQCFSFSFIWGLLFYAVLWFTSDTVVALFNNNTQVVTVATLYLLIVPWSYGLEGFRLIVSSALNGIGRPRMLIVLMFVKTVAFYIPFAFILSNWLGIKGIFIAEVVGNIAVGVLSLFQLKKISALSKEPLAL